MILYEISRAVCKRYEQLVPILYQKSKDFKEYVKKVHNNSLEDILADICQLNLSYQNDISDNWIILYSWDNGDYTLYNTQDNKVYIFVHDNPKNNAGKYGVNLFDGKGSIIYWKEAAK